MKRYQCEKQVSGRLQAPRRPGHSFGEGVPLSGPAASIISYASSETNGAFKVIDLWIK